MGVTSKGKAARRLVSRRGTGASGHGSGRGSPLLLPLAAETSRARQCGACGICVPWGFSWPSQPGKEALIGAGSVFGVHVNTSDGRFGNAKQR